MLVLDCRTLELQSGQGGLRDMERGRVPHTISNNYHAEARHLPSQVNQLVGNLSVRERHQRPTAVRINLIEEEVDSNEVAM